jgi:hypothetical protein
MKNSCYEHSVSTADKEAEEISLIQELEERFNQLVASYGRKALEDIVAWAEDVTYNSEFAPNDLDPSMFLDPDFVAEMKRKATVIHFQAMVTEGTLEHLPTSVRKPKLLDDLKDNFPDEVVVADGICQLNGVDRGNVHPCGYVVQGEQVSALQFEFPFGTSHEDGGLIIEGKCRLEIPLPCAVSREDAKKIVGGIRKQKKHYDCGFCNVFGKDNRRRLERVKE